MAWFYMAWFYITMKQPREYTCVICSRKFSGWGNNPYPLKDKGECCNGCNDYVIAKRIAQIQKDVGK